MSHVFDVSVNSPQPSQHFDLIIQSDKPKPKKKLSFNKKKDQKLSKSNENFSLIQKSNSTIKKKSQESVFLEKIKTPKANVLEKLRHFLFIKSPINGTTNIIVNSEQPRRGSIFYTKQFSTELNEMVLWLWFNIFVLNIIIARWRLFQSGFQILSGTDERLCPWINVWDGVS